MSFVASPALRLRAVCLALFLGTALLFSRAVNHGFLDYDDPDYVTQNAHVQGGFTRAGLHWAFTSRDAANWHPLTWLSHMLDWRMFGDDPRGHHATSVAWHALVAVMAFLALRRLTGAFWTSAFCAALFAWHPLRVESVAWIAERKDVLSVFFGLATLWAYAGYGHRRRKNLPGAWRDYFLALGLFAAGLLCKPMLVTLPCLLLVLDWWPLQRVRPARLVREKAPFFLLAACSCIVTYVAQKGSNAVNVDIPLAGRLGNAVVSVVRYLGKFFWPFDLAVGYPYSGHWPLPAVVAAAVLVLGISAAAFGQRRRRPWLLVGWLWFLGTLVPVIGLVQVGLQAMADRYTYFPLLGVQVALLWSCREWRPPARWRWLAPAAAGLVLAGCAARTWNQLGVWRSSISLYEHTLAVTTDNYLTEGYLGTTLLNDNRPAEAAVHFRRALAIKPDDAIAQVRLGIACEQQGRPAEAAAEFSAVLRYRPNFSDAHYELGSLLLAQGQPGAALPHLQASLRSKPGNDAAWVDLGLAEAKLGQPALALVAYRQAAALRPDSFAACWNEAELLHRLGRAAEAVAPYRRARELEPKNAEAADALGAVLEELGQLDEAAACYAAEARLQPERAQGDYNLAVLLLNRGQAPAALGHFQAAVRIEPGFAPAYVGLGQACVELGHPAEAAAAFRQARRLDPTLPGVADALARLRSAPAGK